MSKLGSNPLTEREWMVKRFNHELDRALQGNPLTEDDLPPEETQALHLAQELTSLDFSHQSAVKQSLRRQLSERSSRIRGNIAILHWGYLLREGRALAGIGVMLLLGCVLAFGMLTSHSISATPAYQNPAASAAMSELPVGSFTTTAARNPSVQPQPVPTPLAISATILPTLPERTPVLTDPFSGNSYPAITTTTAK